MKLPWAPWEKVASLPGLGNAAISERKLQLPSRFRLIGEYLEIDVLFASARCETRRNTSSIYIVGHEPSCKFRGTRFDLEGMILIQWRNSNRCYKERRNGADSSNFNSTPPEHEFPVAFRAKQVASLTSVSWLSMECKCVHIRGAFSSEIIVGDNTRRATRRQMVVERVT